jgi:hypothetical protein
VWIQYPKILLGEWLQLASVRLQIILWLRNANNDAAEQSQRRAVGVAGEGVFG